MQVKTLSILFLLFICIPFAQAQHPSVQWRITASRSSNAEWQIDIKASLRPGWHIYSQHINEGGPTPTVIMFDESQDYIILGKVVEVGDPVKFYDSLYEMEITWYMEQVCFR